MTRIAIHGFGRIGRTTLRAALIGGVFTPAIISDINDPAALAALFEVDSNYGRWHEKALYKDNMLVIGDKMIPYHDCHNGLPDWGEHKIDLVIDCTGGATVRKGAEAHLARGAKRVLVSASSESPEDCDAVLLAGINLNSFTPKEHLVISMASCTTNALAPVVKVLEENFGIDTAFFTAVHAYTSSQSLTDQTMSDRRMSWAAAENIIPSNSRAARILQCIWPELDITGKVYHIPLRTGSIVEVIAFLKSNTTRNEVQEAFRQAALWAPLINIMTILEREWPSARIIGEQHSSIIDLPLVEVKRGNLVSVAAWYDNEMGYAARLAGVAHAIAKPQAAE